MAIIELFYNPYTRQSGKFGIIGGKTQQGLQMDKHEDHLHIASDNAEEMKTIMKKAHDMGFNVHENPYATKQGWDPDGVQKVHGDKSWHYKSFKDGTGGAVDITGDKNKLYDFIDNYIYKEITTKPTPSDSLKDTDTGKSSEKGSGSKDNKSPSLLDAFFTDAQKYLDTNEGKSLNEMVEPVSTTSKTYNSKNLYTYKPLIDDDVVSPDDGKVEKVSKDNNTQKYTIIISHSIEGKKYISTINGLSSSYVTDGEHVIINQSIGTVAKNSLLTWQIVDKSGKSVNPNKFVTNKKSSTDKDDEDKNKDNNKEKINKNIPLAMRSAMNFNPIGMMMKAAKVLTNVKESTQKNNVLTEEIQRIKKLMK
jgi:hypothetical protein